MRNYVNFALLDHVNILHEITLPENDIIRLKNAFVKIPDEKPNLPFFDLIVEDFVLEKSLFFMVLAIVLRHVVDLNRHIILLRNRSKVRINCRQNRRSSRIILPMRELDMPEMLFLFQNRSREESEDAFFVVLVGAGDFGEGEAVEVHSLVLEGF